MIRVPYDKDRQFDMGLQCIINKVMDSTMSEDKKDDFLLMCVSETGGGKSMLMLHVLEEYMKERANVNLIGLNRSSFATALKTTTENPLPRFLANDEANISKRDSITKYNKKIIDLYFSIRGKRIFHWWNNPSLDILDKSFIEERLKGVIFIPYKLPRIRIYYYFEDHKIIEIFQKYKMLKLHILKKVAKTHSKYRGWFRDYKGSLLEPYNQIKETRMTDKVTEFYDEYCDFGKNGLRIGQIRKSTGLGIVTINSYVKELTEKGILTDEHYITAPTGHRIFQPVCIEIFTKLALEKRKRTHERNLKNRR